MNKNILFNIKGIYLLNNYIFINYYIYLIKSNKNIYINEYNLLT